VQYQIDMLVRGNAPYHIIPWEKNMYNAMMDSQHSPDMPEHCSFTIPLMQSASDSIQAHERLFYQVKSKLRDSTETEAQDGEG